MLLSEDRCHASFYIRSYSEDGIHINDTVYQSSLLLSPTHLLSDWPPHCVAELKSMHWQAVIDLAPSIVILGTGKQQVFPHASVLKDLYAAKLGIEIMTTAAACRTFNILSSEGRHVVAALLL